MKPLEDGGSDPVDREAIGATERREGFDPRCAEQLPLASVDVGDEAEVVIGDTPVVADAAPAAEAAVIDRLGIGVAAAVPQGSEELVPDVAEVGRELGEAERALLTAAEDDVDLLGLEPLRGRQQLAVEASWTMKYGFARRASLVSATS